MHRDLKPSNVLLAADGPRVIDFGIARAVEATAVTKTGIRVGTPPFMAPEQVEGLPVAPSIDVFALGSVATYAALGRPPFGEGNDAAMLYRVMHQAPDLDRCPPELRELIERCLAKQVSERPSLEEVIAECRTRTAARTLQITQTWLPAPVAADLARHAPPPTEDWQRRDSSPGAHVQGGGNDRQAFVEGRGETPSTATARAGWTSRNWRTVRENLVRRPLAAAVAALIVGAGTVAGLVVVLDPGGTRGGTATSPAAKVAPAASHGGSPAANARRSAAPNLDPCLIGTWKVVSRQVVNRIDGAPVQFTGSGGTDTYRSDGTTVTDFGRDTALSARVNGADWTETVRGKMTARWEVRNGDLKISHTSAHGTVKLRRNGVVNNSIPLKLKPSTTPYRCSGDTLRQYDDRDGVTKLTRQTTPP